MAEGVVMDDDAYDEIAPLTENESADASTIAPDTAGPNDGEIVSPVPLDAPQPPRTHPNLGAPTAFWTYRDARGAVLQIINRFDPPGQRKQYRPCTLWRSATGLQWRWTAPPPPRPLYRLDRLAANPDALVVVCEGEKSADEAALIFPNDVSITSPAGSQAAEKADWSPLAGRRVRIWPDADEPGLKYATQVARILSGLRCEVSVIDAMALAAIDPISGGIREPAKGCDAADAIAEWPDLEALRRTALALAKPYAAAENLVDDGQVVPDEAAIERRVAELGALSEIKYETVRKAEANELGISLRVLDKLVRAKRPQDDPGQGRAISFPTIEPWPQPAVGAAVLDELVATLRCYVVLTTVQAVAVALWIAFTHFHDAFDVSPRLAVKSPQKRSGKTTLFAVLGRVVARPRGASGITSSALLRLIELHCPTMLIDEMDALMAGDKEMSQALRGLMNAGFDRAFATFTMNIKTGDGGYEPREFSCWAPLALAGIGDVPETVRDRSIEIEMKRKLPSETVKKLRRRDGADLNEISRKLARWSLDSIDKLRTAEPKMPDGLNDRAADAWEPLVAIADLAGGEWPTRAKAAALALSGDDLAVAKDEEIDTMLLADIRDAFTSKGVDKLSGETLTEFLTGLEGRPWADWKHGKPLTKFQLARRLKTYGAVSGALDLGSDEGRLKGYRLEDFHDAFSRYLPSRPISTRELVLSPGIAGETEDLQLVMPKSGHEFKTAKIPSNSGRQHEFTSSRPPSESVGTFHGKDAPANRGDEAAKEQPVHESDGKRVWAGRAVL
jgi:putative DNA primase/helicase